MLLPDAARRSARLPLARLRPDPAQPRKEFDWDRIKELAASIRSNGQWVRAIVRPDPGREEDFLLIDGERRWRAMPLVPSDALDVEIVSGPLDPSQLLLVQTSLGLTGQRLDPLELGDACQRLMQLFGLAPKELAERLGTSAGTVSKLLRILKDLAEPLRADVQSGALPFTVAYAVARLKEVPRQLEVAEKFKAGLLKRDSVEEAVTRLLGARPKRPDKLVQGKTPGGLSWALAPGNPERALEEVLRLARGVKECLQKGYDLSLLPGLLKGREPP